MDRPSCLRTSLAERADWMDVSDGNTGSTRGGCKPEQPRSGVSTTGVHQPFGMRPVRVAEAIDVQRARVDAAGELRAFPDVHMGLSGVVGRRQDPDAVRTNSAGDRSLNPTAGQ